MNAETDKIRGYRLRAHHLDRKLPAAELVQAAGVCGLQNSPPGAWEAALLNRLEGFTPQLLGDALYGQKSLLQAWSYRGAPVVFPTAERDIFLTALRAREGEQPWIYTMGVAGALEFLGMSFDELLPRVLAAAGYLDSHTVESKETLDATLAALAAEGLPEDKRRLWDAPSMYGRPDRQTVGGAVVSFMLRPCAFSSLVVFGERQGISPTFTSLSRWMGSLPPPLPDADKELTRRFLRCYGPTTVNCFMSWLGASPAQARRLWNAIADEMEPVRVNGKTCYLLSGELDSLQRADSGGERLLLLGAHDPYLDIRDRTVILENQSLHKEVWKFVANPGAILKGGRVAGVWRARAGKGKLEVSMKAWEALQPGELRTLESLAGEHAALRQLELGSCTVEA